jgi:hypothetical protein
MACGAYPDSAWLAFVHHHCPVNMTSITEYDLRISAVTQAIADTEAGLVELRQEKAQLQIARNAVTPLLCLPDELLVRIATTIKEEIEDGDEDPVVLFDITAVCRRLRVLFLATPELWTFFDIAWGYTNVANIFLPRTPSRSLHLKLDTYPESLELLPWFSHVQRLKITLFSHQDQDGTWPIVRKLKYYLGPRLRTLELEKKTKSDMNWHLRSTLLDSSSCRALTSLRLSSLDGVVSLPILPALRCLEIRECNLSLSVLRECMLQSPLIERLKLRRTMKAKPPSHALQQQVPLPALRYMSIEDNHDTLPDLLQLLPNPAHTFHVAIANPYWPGRVLAMAAEHAVVNALITSRLGTFSDSITGEIQGGALGAGVQTLTRLFLASDGAQIASDVAFGFSEGPSAFHGCICDDSDQNYATLTSIKTVHIVYSKTQHHSHLNPVKPGPDHLDLGCMCGVEVLVIEHAQFDGVSHSSARALESCVLSQQFMTVEFRQCAPSVKSLYERLEAGEAADKIFWARMYLYFCLCRVYSDESISGLIVSEGDFQPRQTIPHNNWKVDHLAAQARRRSAVGVRGLPCQVS